MVWPWTMKNSSWFHDFKRVRLVWGITSRKKELVFVRSWPVANIINKKHNILGILIPYFTRKIWNKNTQYVVLFIYNIGFWTQVTNKRRSWNMFSPKTCFRHFLAFDLTSSVTDWSRTLSLYSNRFVLLRAARSFFREAQAQSQLKRHRGLYQLPPHVCRGKWPKWPCRRRLAHV